MQNSFAASKSDHSCSYQLHFQYQAYDFEDNEKDDQNANYKFFFEWLRPNNFLDRPTSPKILISEPIPDCDK